MKYLLSALLLFLLLPVLVQGQQNHVPNGSFEDTIGTCPSGQSQVGSRCASWTDFYGSPDYFHTCNSTSVGVPANAFGYQNAAHGVAYVGFCTHIAGVSFEYVCTPIQPLIIGARYEVSMSVNLTNNSQFATNNIGVFFYDTFGTPTSSGILPISPQVHYSNLGVISDTGNWVRLSQIFVADSAYDNIAIGGFNNSNNTYSIDTVNYASSGYAFYLIDSIVIKLAKRLAVNFKDTALCTGDTIRVPYDVNTNPVFFQNNNVFTMQLSDASGSFTNPVNIGTKASYVSDTIICVIPINTSAGSGYRLRMISSSGQDTSSDNGYNIKIGNSDSFSVSSTSNSPICKGGVLSLSASTNVTPTSYSWAGPSGFSSTLQNPVINGAIPANGGDYYATLKFYGCEVKDTLSVTVKPLPAKPVANNNSPLCTGDTLHLSSSSSTSGVSYSWAGPGGFASSAQDTSVASSTTAMSGNYIVTAHLNGCNRKDTTTVLVKPLPTAVTLSNNGPLCAGDTLHLSSTASTTGVSYNWTGPGSFSATTQNTNRANSTAVMTGWYKMMVGLNGCTYTDSTYATVHPIPSMPNISYTNPLCVGETLNLGTTTVSGATYNWAGPNNFSSSAQSPARSNMQFGDTGTYKLITTVNGCSSDTAAATVKINPLPFVVVFANPADSICQGDRVSFTALPNNHGGTPAYQWYVNGQASGTGTVFSTTTLNNQDVVRVDMTENTKCRSTYTDPSNDITMNVLPWLAPTVGISVSPNRPLKENEYATFTATATNAGNNPQYQWKRNGQDIVGATGSVWSANTLNDNDSISVEIVSNYKCPQPPDATSNVIVVKVLTGVTGMNNLNGLTLYPNPNSGRFVLKGEAPLRLSLKGREVLNLEIINAMGQVVYRDEVAVENGIVYKEINLSDASAGMYVLKLQGRTNINVLSFNIY